MNSYMSLAKDIKKGKTVYRKTYIDRVPASAENLENLYNINLSCIFNEQGERVLYERFSGTKSLIICGGGHISVPVCVLAKMLGYQVIVFEDRQDFADKTRFPNADLVICGDFNKLLSKYDWKKQPDTSVVIVTRGHVADTVCLREVINKDLPYIGMIGSYKKNAAVFDLLRKEGVNEQNIKKVFAPIGLKIGAKTPEEIAIAIAGQLIQTRSQNTDSVLSENMLNALCDEQNKGSVMATVINKSGSAPRGIGARMLRLKSGEIIGTIGGGLAEFEAIKIMQNFKNGDNSIHHFNMSNGEAGKSGMICGGQIDVLFEVI